jgi:hypothetical protein
MYNNYETIVSKIATNKYRKSYMEVDGKPFLYNAVQSWYPPEKDYSTYIQKAAEANFKCFSFWLYWRDLEPVKGKRDWSELDKVIDLAVKYDIRTDIIWGGTNFCNHMDPRFTPDWVLNDPCFRQKDKSGNDVLIDGRDMGLCYMVDAKNKQILEVEKEILTDLIAHLEAYDKTHRVIAIQVENEINLDGYYPEEKDNVMAYINELGKNIKEMNYKIVTRANICAHKMDFDIDKLEYIDGHGVDTYDPRVNETREAVLDPANTKFKYIAENAAFENSTSHIIAALANGGFYNIYKVDYDIYHQKPGVFDKDWEENATTINIRNLNGALNKMGSLIAESPKEKMLEFNTETDQPLCNYITSKELSGIKIGLKTSNSNSVGFAAEKDNAYYCIADKNAQFFTDIKPVLCENGYIDNSGTWVCMEEREVINVSEGHYQIRYTTGECLKITL